VNEAGYSWTAANRAKAKAGIQSAKEKGKSNGGWVWVLSNFSAMANGEEIEESEEIAEKIVDSSISSVDSSSMGPEDVSILPVPQPADCQ
jgi:hypothetical protein